MDTGFFDKDKTYKEVRERYNLKFVDLIYEKGYKTYLFGGSLRDMVLGREWKDADLRTWIPLPPKERDEKIESILDEANIDYGTKIVLDEKFTIYRFLPEGSKAEGVIDFTVVSNEFEVIPDFTINGLYFDLNVKELVNKHNALEDIQKKIIRTVLSPDEQFTIEPHMIFRAVKCACQFGFKIDEKTLLGMKAKADLTEGTLSVVSDDTFPGMTEWFIGNIFRGIKYDPKKFVDLWNESGLSNVFINFIGKRLSISPKSNLIPQIFDVGDKYDYETSLCMFLSSVTRVFDKENPNEIFPKILNLFRLDKPSVYGDFVVDNSKLVYI